MLVYGGLLLLGSGLLVTGFAQRPTLRVNALRDRAVLARQVGHGAVENVYRLQVMNAQERPRDLRISVHGVEGLQLTSADTLRLPPPARRNTA